jgi:hypothetical protein
MFLNVNICNIKSEKHYTNYQLNLLTLNIYIQLCTKHSYIINRQRASD